MKKRRVILRIVALAIIATIVTLWLLASRVPSDYQPITLTPQEKVKARESIQAKMLSFIRLAGEIGSLDPNEAPQGQGWEEYVEEVVGPDGKVTTRPATRPSSRPVRKREFQMPITQIELNEWAATVSEKLANSLQQMGMSEPAIAIGNDRLTFYSHWDAYDKVVGLDLGLHFNKDSTMTITIDSARMGDLPMPDATLEKNKKDIVNKLQTHVRGMSQDSGGAGDRPTKLFNDAASKVADAISGKPVQLDIRQDFGNVRIRGIKLENGQAVLDVVTLLPDNAAAGGTAADAAKGAPPAKP